MRADAEIRRNYEFSFCFFEPLEQQWKIFHGAAIVAKIEAARSSAKGEVTASSIAGQEMS